MYSLKDMTRAFASEFGTTQVAAKAAIEFIFEDIAKQLMKGESCQVPKFGVFKAKPFPARTVKSPQSGEMCEVDASARILFTASSDLKESTKAVLGPVVGMDENNKPVFNLPENIDQIVNNFLAQKAVVEAQKAEARREKVRARMAESAE